MRTLLCMAMIVGVVAVACAGKKRPQTPPTGRTAPTSPQAIVTPETSLAGKVVTFNPDGRFAVLNFPIGHLPALGQRLSVYRFGLKVGEIRVTGPQRDDDVVGDVVAGEARQGDEVREQ